MEQIGQFLPLILLVVVFWLFIIRPMRKRQREATEIQQSVAVGSRVMLGSGIFGTVVGIDDETFELTIAPGTEITVHRQAIGKVFAEPPAVTDDAPEQSDGPDQSDKND